MLTAYPRTNTALANNFFFIEYALTTKPLADNMFYLKIFEYVLK